MKKIKEKIKNYFINLMKEYEKDLKTFFIFCSHNIRKNILPYIIKKTNLAFILIYLSFKGFERFIYLLISLFRDLLFSFFGFILIPLFNKLRVITPNLTLYFPLTSSIISVSIRFMGTFLMILLFTYCCICCVVGAIQVSFIIISFFCIPGITLTGGTTFYHIIKSIEHFLTGVSGD